MTSEELIALFERSGKRWCVAGTAESGVIAGLDLEGRLFAVLNGEVLNRVNAAAFSLEEPDGYRNPGGDGLWPAPEGTTLGYEYPTGDWRVPPSLVGARYYVAGNTAERVCIRANVDLINNSGLGVPTSFEREFSCSADGAVLTVVSEERITYRGTRELSTADCLLAPWTLCQFDCSPGCEVVFEAAESSIRDLYEPSDSQRCIKNGLWHTRTGCEQRYQLGMDEHVKWIEFRNPHSGLRVRRHAEALPSGQSYIDIADAPPEAKPEGKGVCLSVYSDTDGFMEIEAAGGCPEILVPGATMSVRVTTVYSRAKN